MNQEPTPAKVRLTEGLGPLVEYADKLRTLLFGLRDSDPGCTVAAWWGL
jgi:hypothetical protein